MIYDNTFDYNPSNSVHCSILIKPKHQTMDWPEMTERSIVQQHYSVDEDFEVIKNKAIDFALQYIQEHNETSWDNNAIFSGIIFHYPNGMVKRYDNK